LNVSWKQEGCSVKQAFASSKAVETGNDVQLCFQNSFVMYIAIQACMTLFIYIVREV